MPFIGNQPALAFTSFAKQDFTTSATTSYTLDNPVANENELALFINFVRQEPTTAYTASGTTLTLTSATSASDDMYCVYLGKAVQTVNPPSGSVGLSQLSATGTKDSTTFLRGDNTFQTVSSYADSDALSLFNASGSAPVYACRAWIKFNGIGTVSIYGSGNVSSLTDISVGTYRVNLTTALEDTNYSICINTGGGLLSTGSQEFPVNLADWYSTSQINWNQRKCDNDNNTFTSQDSDPVALAVFR
jgi:hypothetical protein